MNDSGKRREFATGSVRDVIEGKPRPELISPIAEERLAFHCAKGAEKYADRNWERGQPLGQILGSLKRHLLSYQLGRTDEDHLAALLWNAMALLHTDEMIQRGELPIDLADLPYYGKEA